MTLAKHTALYGLMIAGLCWFLGFIVFILYAMQFRYIPKVPVQAVAVLTGGTDRLDTALTILKENNLNALLISGVHKDVVLEDLYRKIEPDLYPKITLGYWAENTEQNAKELVDWAKNKKLTHILLVTSFYHIPRSLMEIRALDKRVVIVPYPVFPHHITDSRVLIHTRGAWLLFVEYHKSVFVLFKHLFERIQKCYG